MCLSTGTVDTWKMENTFVSLVRFDLLVMALSLPMLKFKQTDASSRTCASNTDASQDARAQGCLASSQKQSKLSWQAAGRHCYSNSQLIKTV
jgi:hypothetical protein